MLSGKARNGNDFDLRRKNTSAAPERSRRTLASKTTSVPTSLTSYVRSATRVTQLVTPAKNSTSGLSNVSQTFPRYSLISLKLPHTAKNKIPYLVSTSCWRHLGSVTQILCAMWSKQFPLWCCVSASCSCVLSWCACKVAVNNCKLV